MVPIRGQEVVRALHEPRSAAVPAASCGGVSPPARTPGGTPGALAGEDACATSAGQFMVPMHAKKRKGALHEPQDASLGNEQVAHFGFLFPMHAKKRKEALHEPIHPRPLAPVTGLLIEQTSMLKSE